jgi:hypothetical protein
VSEDAARAVALLAVDPFGLGGAVLRGPPGPARDGWLTALRANLPPGTPWRRLPPTTMPIRPHGSACPAGLPMPAPPTRQPPRLPLTGP